MAVDRCINDSGASSRRSYAPVHLDTVRIDARCSFYCSAAAGDIVVQITEAVLHVEHLPVQRQERAYAHPVSAAIKG